MNLNYTMIKLGVILLHLIFFACSTNQYEADKQESNEKPASISILPEKEYQLVHGFGASDAWSCQFVGNNWPEDKKNEIADLLFSKEYDVKGNPKGIGLSVWRFNIGGGSAEQGEASDIKDKWRRAECFLGMNNQLDWSKQSGQAWFLKAAKDRGVENFIAFLNSPPVSLSKNGKAYSSLPDIYNLPQENYDKFVSFIGDVLSHFRDKKDIEFKYISPFNEPQWDWMNPTQEGSPAKNYEIAAISRLLDEKFIEKNISTKIEIPETAQINYLFESGNRPNRGDQINSFFNTNSVNYLGDLERVAHKVAAHSYFSTWDYRWMKESREKVKEKIDQIDPGLEYWMTEYCILEDNDAIKGNGRDLGMNSALYLARVIHADLVVASASSWQWWLAVSPYDYKDGLVYIDFNEFDGNVYESKLLWVLGNYARFIRPGMIRVGTQVVNMQEKLVNCSAYKTNNESEFVLVVSNYDNKDIQFSLDITGIDNYTKLAYITSSKTSDNLRLASELITDGKFISPQASVVTIVLKREN
ncbi:MAG: hypothetical protein N4A71_08225 [Carboxylicivirga sp.]|jgi:O-glycosyl hydrolase|nr:hypothetical protein [Carboxylicivirga sp.]